MASLIISILSVLVIAAVLAWLATRAWTARRGPVRWLGTIAGGLFALLFGLVGIVGLVGAYKLYRPQGSPPSTTQVTATAERLAKGERYAHLCVGCHSTTQNLPLDGSAENFGEGFGSIQPPNLTPGGPLEDWTDGEIMRAIREGVDRTGRPLIIMPSEDFHSMSDEDVQSLVVYLRSQPSIPHDTADTAINLIGALVIGSGMFSPSVQPPITAPVTAPPAGPTREYGGYLVGISGCRTCHGENLTGGTPGGFGPDPGPNLVSLVPGWTDAQFISTIRTGTDPTGHQLDPEKMPWRDFSAMMLDDELRAVYAFIRDGGQP